MTNFVVYWSQFLDTYDKATGSVPGSTIGIFPEGERSHSDHGLGSLAEIMFNP
jgi:hypothetical protein